MKCPTCNGRGKYSRPCQSNHASVHDCYDAGCLIPRACQTCGGEGHVITDAMIEADAKEFLSRQLRRAATLLS